ncbi:hypothetical protein [Asanoa siamensis]|uniref:Excreted virulence factor EspC (Type VII ESX diderm) n=1 Tax=Asanoa siamensis TaxID=926357 RepID=A0ABQ4D5P8_9ACTN|nr:hypothetical protein [Asanoa siamensis]GIF78442.1 hypothetical protein Asi02nite_79600 [Asanoa siamensis]
MSDLDVNSGGIRRSGSGVGSSAEEMARRFTAFQTELATHGQPWGNDDLGSLIGAAYETVREVAMDCIIDNLEGLAGDGSGLLEVADTYDAADETIEADGRAFGERLA